jgi:short-subunit dehydrogenase
MPRHLRDKVILITGASSGIGKATALACAWEGMHVSLAARRGDRLQQVAKQVSDLNRRAHFFTCNVANPQDVRQWIDEAYKTFGRVDAVFANAGYGLRSTFMDTPISAHRDIFETNYFGTVHTLREAFPYLADTRDGLRHLLVCSSCLSELAPPLHGVYAATKAAQDSITQAMRAELAGEGYSVTSVHPVGTRTEFGASLHDYTGKRGSLDSDTPDFFKQDAEKVARAVVRALKNPKPEVWPMRSARLAAAFATAMPRLAAWGLARRYRQLADASPSAGKPVTTPTPPNQGPA